MAQGWVIVAQGEGATARVLKGEMHQEVHDFMCFCGKPWKECGDSVIAEEVAMIDDRDNWALDEDGDLFAIHWPGETGKISLFALHE